MQSLLANLGRRQAALETCPLSAKLGRSAWIARNGTVGQHGSASHLDFPSQTCPYPCSYGFKEAGGFRMLS